MRNDDHIKPKLPEAWPSIGAIGRVRRNEYPKIFKFVETWYGGVSDIVESTNRSSWREQFARRERERTQEPHSIYVADISTRHEVNPDVHWAILKLKCKLCKIIGSAACPRASTIKNTGGEVGPCRRGWSTRNLKLCSYAKDGDKCTRDLSKKS